jgi:CRP-like cAMP-binding protein
MSSPSELETGRGRAVLTRLQALAKLGAAEAASFGHAIERAASSSAAGEYVLREGARFGGLHVVLKGWMLAYKSLEDGRRQITRIILPGDTYGMGWHHLAVARCSVITVTPCDHAVLEQAQLDRLLQGNASLERALHVADAIGAAIQEEWLLSLGRRTALERVSYLVCEVHDRLQAAGLANGASCDFPITQMDLADATGLSIVHVNRVLQELRSAGLISLRSRVVHLHQIRELREIAAYTPIGP